MPEPRTRIEDCKDARAAASAGYFAAGTWAATGALAAGPWKGWADEIPFEPLSCFLFTTTHRKMSTPQPAAAQPAEQQEDMGTKLIGIAKKMAMFMALQFGEQSLRGRR